MNRFMTCKQRSLFYRAASRKKSSSGLTLLELLAGVVIGGILIQLAYFGFSLNRQVYLNDAKRNEIDQTLKSVFDLVGPSIIQAGEGVGSNPQFPVVAITAPNADGDNTITITQLSSTVKLPVCGNIGAGSVTTIAVLDTTTTPPIASCDLVDGNADGYPDNVAIWRNLRLSNKGTLTINLYDGAGDLRELQYTGEKFYDSGGAEITGTPTVGQVARVTLTVSGTATANYTAGSAAQLLLVERRTYRRNGDVLETRLNNSGAWSGLVNGIGRFRATATVRQGAVNSTCARILDTTQTPPTLCAPALTKTYEWSQIYSIEVSVKPKALSSNEPGLTKGVIDALNNLEETQSFYPRNLLNF
ncbi:MAG: prepilin-type cleavage/methylation domain-containing protein [Cyanobacteria bacterium RI_101]|nr:prepilin-type cleavage/methylation domain-containing protein [Cyanobacteria bacterium RI_101]